MTITIHNKQKIRQDELFWLFTNTNFVTKFVAFLIWQVVDFDESPWYKDWQIVLSILQQIAALAPPAMNLYQSKECREFLRNVIKKLKK